MVVFSPCKGLKLLHGRLGLRMVSSLSHSGWAQAGVQARARSRTPTHLPITSIEKDGQHGHCGQSSDKRVSEGRQK